MRRPPSILVSTLIHAAVVGVAIGGFSLASTGSPRIVRVVFQPSEAAPALSPLAAREEQVARERVETELPEPPDPATPPVEPFEPPSPKQAPEPEDRSPLPEELLARLRKVQEPPEPVAEAPAPMSAESTWVDAQAIEADNRPPVYPAVAIERGWTGVVTLELRIDATGVVEAVSVVGSSGHAILDHAAEDAAREWRFEPARQDGIAVASDLRLPVEFRIVDG